MRSACSGWRRAYAAGYDALSIAHARLRAVAAAVANTQEAAVTLRTVQTDRAPAAIGPYSQAVLANGLVFAAGQIPLDPITGQVVGGDVAAQTERVLANLGAVLQAAGASWTSVVKTTVFLQDMDDFPTVNQVYARILGDARPARSTVQVAALPRGVRVEIDAIAVAG
jgi:2-iminobutanoate/2-iminopropanoate deaminase